MKTYCPNCEKETECEFRAELYWCSECDEDFAGYEKIMQERSARLESALMVILDQVDYTIGNCGLTEMVGVVLPKPLIDLAREALKGGES